MLLLIMLLKVYTQTADMTKAHAVPSKVWAERYTMHCKLKG